MAIHATTLAEVAAAVLRDVSATCRPPTVRFYEWHFRRRILPDLGADSAIDSLTPERIHDWLESYRGQITETTRALYWSAISRLLCYAMRDGLIVANPLARLQKPRPNPRRTDFFTPAEVWRIVDAVRSSGRRAAQAHATIIAFLFLTGLRLAELCRLTPRSLHLRTSELYVDGKTEPRYVLLSPSAVDAFCELEPAMPLNSSGIRAALRTWAARLDLRGRLRAHALRHSHATALVASGVPLPQVARMLGHASVEMSYRYTHATPAAREAVLALEPPGGSGSPSTARGGCPTLSRSANPFPTEMPRPTTADPRKPSAAATTLAERLLKAREEAGFAGREEAAQASGGDISRQNLAGWELGRNLPGYRAIHRLCKLYGVSADWLLGLD